MQSKELVQTHCAILKFSNCNFVLVKFLLNQLLPVCAALKLCQMNIIYTFPHKPCLTPILCSG